MKVDTTSGGQSTATPAAAASLPPSPHAGSFKSGALTLTSNIIMALGSVAPTLSVAVTLAGILAASGLATPIVVLVLTIPMLGVATAYRRLNSLEPNCGSVFMWSARAVSPYVGFMIGWIMIVAYVLAVLSGVMAIGPYVLDVFVSNPHGLQVVEAVAATVVTAFITMMAYLGIDVTARVQWAFVVVEYVSLALITTLGLIFVFGHHHGSVPFTWHWFSWKELGGTSGFVAAALTVVFLFSGWDTAIAVNEETQDSRRNPGNAAVIAVLLAGLIFAFVMFSLQGVVSSSHLQAHGANALAYLGQVLGGTALSRVMVAMVVLSATGGALASLVTGVRLAFAMSSEHVFPERLGQTHPVHKTPAFATIVLGALSIAVVWPYVLGASSVVNSFEVVVSSDGLLFALFYAATGLTLFMHYRRLAFSSARNVLELCVFPVGSGLFLLFMAYKSVGDLGGWGGKNLITLYGLLGVGGCLLIYYRTRGNSSYFDLRGTSEPDVAPAETGPPSAV